MKVILKGLQIRPSVEMMMINIAHCLVFTNFKLRLGAPHMCNSKQSIVFQYIREGGTKFSGRFTLNSLQFPKN